MLVNASLLNGQYKPSFIERLFEQHKSILQDHQSFWKEIAKISLPMAMRHIEESGEDTRRVRSSERREIYNDVVADAVDIAVAGLMTSMTPAESPWFTTGIVLDGEMLTMQSVGSGVKKVIDVRTGALRTALYTSNFYSVMSEVYRDGLMFGNAGVLMDEDDKLDGNPTYEYVPLGTYIVLEDHRSRIIGFIRKISYTTQQMVTKFVKDSETGEMDWDKVSKTVRLCWDTGQWYGLHEVFQAILPSQKGDEKPYCSFFFEKGLHEERFASEGKHSYFPFYFWRWSKRQGEPYSKDCPGMKTFHTNDMLQTLEKGCMHGYNQKADPTLKVSPEVDVSLYNRQKHGGVVVVRDPKESLAEPLFDGMMYPFAEVEKKIERKELKIREGFYNNMFLAFLNSSRTEKTREEIIRKYEEKLAMLAPTVGRIKEDLLNPMLRDASMMLERAGKIPKVSAVKKALEEQVENGIQGKTEVMPVYTSLLMQAMRAVGSQDLNNFLGIVGSLAQVVDNSGAVDSPWDWVETDNVVLSQAEQYFIPAINIREKKAVVKIRASRLAQRQQEAKQQQLEAMTKAGGGVPASGNLETSTVDTLIGG